MWRRLLCSPLQRWCTSHLCSCRCGTLLCSSSPPLPCVNSVTLHLLFSSLGGWLCGPALSSSFRAPLCFQPVWLSHNYNLLLVSSVAVWWCFAFIHLLTHRGRTSGCFATYSSVSPLGPRPSADQFVLWQIMSLCVNSLVGVTAEVALCEPYQRVKLVWSRTVM